MDLLLEIGTEELPASFQAPAVEAMKEALLRELLDARLAACEGAGEAQVRCFSTPRRLALWASGVAARGLDVKRVQPGPPLKAAYDAAGKPTRAAEGFARKLGVGVEALVREGDRVVVVQELKGQPAREALPAILDRLVAGIPFRKSMRWGEGSAAFARPVHWIAAALDGEPLAVSYADVQSAPTTRGHRFHAPEVVPLPPAQRYLDELRARRVIADPAERKARIWAEVQRAAAEAGPGAEPLPDPELLDTVTGLVEEPFAVLGRFEPAFLELPPEVLVSEMRGHQKYFAVRAGGGGPLLPAFVAVSNTRVADPAVSRRGYERVLRARLSDGRFFFVEDRKIPLLARAERLARIVFFQGLGTQAERAQRLETLALHLQEKIGWGQRAQVQTAARLCKADLASGMVGEFPELQGTMGATYARLEGQPLEVCQAIEEHYWPKSAEGTTPVHAEGMLLALADRLDQLVGFFGVGKEPTGTADPFALRRAAIGVLRIVLGARPSGSHVSGDRPRFDLRAALAAAQEVHGAQATAGAHNRVSQEAALVEKVWGFLLGRLEVLWKERAPADAVAAVLGTGATDLVVLEKRLDALAAERSSHPERFAAAAGAFKRIGNILAQAREKKIPAMALHPEAATAEAERALGAALTAARAAVQAAAGREEYGAAWAVLAELRPAVDRFFDEVMVMDPEAAVRDHRLALLRALHELFAPLADFARLQA